MYTDSKFVYLPVDEGKLLDEITNNMAASRLSRSRESNNATPPNTQLPRLNHSDHSPRSHRSSTGSGNSLYTYIYMYMSVRLAISRLHNELSPM